MSNYSPNNPYAQPMEKRPTTAKPAGNPSTVLIWQMVYVVLMTLLYLALTIGSAFLFSFASELSDAQTPPEEIQFMAIAFGLIAGVCALVFAIGLFWRFGNGGWIFQLVLICIGLTSCATWPLTIPLLIGWIKHKDSIVKKRK